jgi:hypothetical protein
MRYLCTLIRFEPAFDNRILSGNSSSTTPITVQSASTFQRRQPTSCPVFSLQLGGVGGRALVDERKLFCTTNVFEARR